jgi:hypothetical protein
LILLDGACILNGVRAFGHALALTSQDGLVDIEAVALDGQNPAVCGDPVTNCHRDDVSRHQVVSLDAANVPIAYDLGFVSRVFLKGGDGFFGARFLGDSDDGVENEDGEDLMITWSAHACQNAVQV